VVGHRFRTTFDNFDTPIDHFIVNQFRMAWKNFTEGVWIEWLDRTRRRHRQQLSEHPEGLWARVWKMFCDDRASADAKRAHLHGHRVHDEFWYADRFGLNGPRLAPLPGESASGGFRSTGNRRRARGNTVTPNESGKFVLELDYEVEHLHICESNNVQTTITLVPDQRLAMSQLETHETLDGVAQRGTRLTFVVVLTKSSVHASSGTASANLPSRAAKTSPNVAHPRN